jgi:hypothetical protein
MRTFTHLLLAAGFLAAGQLFAADPAGSTSAPPLRKVAIIVENRAGAQLNDKVSVLEDLLSSRIAGNGYSVLSRDVVTRALKDYSTGTPPNDQATALDRSLESSTTALRLAQNIGAYFILIPSITTYGSEKKTYNGTGISTVNITHTLRVSYKIVEGGMGGAIRGDTVTASKTIRQSPDLQVESSDVINELLDDAAGQLAGAIMQNAASLPAEVAKDNAINFSVACTMTDIKQQPITVPNVQLTSDNRVVKTNSTPLEVQPLDVTVELDGVAIGSAPGSFQARPGLHKLRLSREGFDAWERTINVYAGQKLRVALQMSDKGFARWEENMAFLQGLENGRKLTDAQVKVLEGYAKFLSESHYRVDTKENIHIYKSLY